MFFARSFLMNSNAPVGASDLAYHFRFCIIERALRLDQQVISEPVDENSRQAIGGAVQNPERMGG